MKFEGDDEGLEPSLVPATMLKDAQKRKLLYKQRCKELSSQVDALEAELAEKRLTHPKTKEGPKTVEGGVTATRKLELLFEALRQTVAVDDSPEQKAVRNLFKRLLNEEQDANAGATSETPQLTSSHELSKKSVVPQLASNKTKKPAIVTMPNKKSVDVNGINNARKLFKQGIKPAPLQPSQPTKPVKTIAKAAEATKTLKKKSMVSMSALSDDEDECVC